MVDCADRDRIDEARQELHRIINDREMRDSIILIFDEAGYIAGTQSVIRLHNTDTTVMQYNPAYMVRKTFIISCFLLFKTQLDSWFDEEVYVTTMYFVDPDIINSGGRTPEMFEAQGTGDRLVMRVSVAK